MSMSATPVVTLDGLSVNGLNGNLRATLKLHSSISFRPTRVTVAVRDVNGRNLDFPGAVEMSIYTTGSVYVSEPKRFLPGTYSIFGSYLYQGVWHPLPKRDMVIGPQPEPVPTPAPVPVPVPVPSPTPTPSAPLGVPGGWRLAWSDEFTGTSLDTSKWTPGWFPNSSGISNPVGGSELQGYDARQVTVADGKLTIKAEAKPVKVPNGSNKAYSSGLVSSNGKYQFTYGVVEFRANIEADFGGKVANWPALWTDGQSWPGDGEIDVMEGLGGGAAYHLHSPNGGPGANYPGSNTGWHVYAADWRPGSVTFYKDGAKVGSLAYDRKSPNYLIVNLAVGSWGGVIKVPGVLQVDYVRHFVAA